MPEKLNHPYIPFEIASSATKAFDFNELSKSLRIEHSFETEGRAAITIARADNLTVVLTALKQGHHLKQHTAPSSATVIVLEGKLSFSTSDNKAYELPQNNSVVFASDVLHSVEALEDSTILIVIGGRAS